MKKNFQVCVRCVMDTTDQEIIFDESGVCNHCLNAEKVAKKIWFPNEVGSQKLTTLIDEIKKNGIGKKYDVIAGISGGIDSSYLVYKAAVEWGLRILAIHVDGGWNNKIAVNNVKAVCSFDNVDLKIIKINWDEMRRLQLAFLKASVPNQDIPQDHAFFSTLYSYAIANDIKYVLNGSNWETENILPSSWGYDASDGKHIQDIFDKNGEGKLTSYPITSVYKLKIIYPRFKKMEIVRPLNLIPYNKEKAMSELIEHTEWEYYGGKHYESIWTKFFQAYYLPKKFGIDKRKAHLSSLIMSGQITREKALEELSNPPFDEVSIKKEINMIANKLEISYIELEDLITGENQNHSDYYRTDQSFIYKNLQNVYKKLKYKISSPKVLKNKKVVK